MWRKKLLFLGCILMCSGCRATPAPKPTSIPVLQETTVPSPSPVTIPQATMSPTPKPSLSPNAFRVIDLPSSFHSDATRSLDTIDTIVIHSLYNPKFPEDLSVANAKAILDISEVSSHYVIARDGVVYRLVPEEYQAWHAGESLMPDGRSKVNAFSIGIELIATETSGITSAQYRSLTLLTTDITNRLQIRTILGHSDIAPGRKSDPWGFDWKTWCATGSFACRRP